MDIPLLGLSIVRTKALPTLSPVESRGGWWPLLRESYAGAWQSNIEVSLSNVATNPTLFSCVTLISSDIGKMGLRLMAKDDQGIWTETESQAFSPVLRKPNRYQTRIKFIEQWILSKLLYGNAYALKQRDNRGVVVALYLLDPNRVKVLVAPDGAVYYELNTDLLAGLQDSRVIVPQREMIHDVMFALYHPLVGLSPVYACGVAAYQAYQIQNSSTQFFKNGSNPGGVLTAPGTIKNETAQRLKEYWEANFSGDNAGKIAVLGDGLKFEQMAIAARDSQLIDQLKWTDEKICSCYHVPPYMVGVGAPPTYTNIQALSVQYYTQCIQSLVENLELCLDEGLELPKPYGTEFNVADLLRMDSATMMDFISKGIGAGVMKPNEGRFLLNAKPVDGGDTPYLQQQNYSLAALNRRDQESSPPSDMVPDTEAESEEEGPEDEPSEEETPESDAPEDDTEEDDAEEDEVEDTAEETRRFESRLMANVRGIHVTRT